MCEMVPDHLRIHASSVRTLSQKHPLTIPNEGSFTPVLAKHSTSFSLIDSISVGVDRMQMTFDDSGLRHWCQACHRPDVWTTPWSMNLCTERQQGWFGVRRLCGARVQRDT